MPKLSKKTLAVFAAATVGGACLHFVYALLPNPVTALISPVNESLWEHLKILFWPFLAGAFFLSRGRGKESRGPWLLALLIVCAAMLAVGYVYHVTLSGGSLFFDVALYVLLMGGGFLLAVLLDVPGIRAKSDLLLLLAAALCAAIAIFTFLPPDSVLFADLSRTNTWSTIPYC